MSDFRDAIAAALSDHFNAHRGPWPITATPEHQRGYADTVLAMPEMQAIRGALRLLHAIGDAMCEDTLTDLPPAVVAWVLGDEP